MAGGLSTGVDIALLYVLHGTLHVQLTVATLISVIVSFVVNFTLNRVWSFGSVQPVGSQMVRYLILAGFNWVSTALLVSGLAAIGVFYLLARLITIAVNSVINYIAYKHWVFKSA
nr:GtrA family protein [Kitasatospora sp. SID7827]